MYDSIRNLMRDRVRNREYLITSHAYEELLDDDLTVFDLEHAILDGEIIERQRDTDTNETKYVLRGATLDDGFIIVVAKLPITRRLVIITVFRDHCLEYEN